MKSRVMVLHPSGRVSPSDLGERTADTVVTVVSYAKPNVDDVLWLAVPRKSGLRGRFAASLWRGIGRSAAGRALFRLTPFDGGALFWAAVREHRPILAELERTDILIAGERDGILATWKLQRRMRTPVTAMNGYPAGCAAIERHRR